MVANNVKNNKHRGTENEKETQQQIT